MGHTSREQDPMRWRALDDLVTRVIETRSAIAAMQAREAALLADAAALATTRAFERRAAGRREANDLALREVTSELGAAMRLSDRTVQERMSSASTLRDAFASTLRAFEEGEIDAAHAGAIVDAGACIADAGMRAEYERIVLDAAHFETPARLRAIARVVAARIDPAIVAELQGRGFAGRRVRVTDLGDGMARLLADLPSTLAHAIHDRLTQMGHEIRTAVATDAGGRAIEEEPADSPDGSAGCAKVVTGPGPAGGADGSGRSRGDGSGRGRGDGSGRGAADVVPSGGTDLDGGPGADGGAGPAPDASDLRTMDELRADVLADLLLCGAPTAHGDGDALASIRAHVQVTVPVLTAAGIDDEPALLAGSGPIDRETACLLAASAPGWDRVMYHPHTGAPLAVDRYRPSEELRRFLRVRDERCRFPGCTQRPWRCDLDHTVDAARGGATDDTNLAHFCRRHHTVKHATAWTVRQRGQGRLEWTSLTGRRYVDMPPSLVQFVPSRGFSPPARRATEGDAPF